MYLRFNQALELDKSSRKKLFFVVAGAHFALITVMYLSFFIQNYFWNMAPSAIAVNLISSSAFEAMEASQSSPAPQSQPKQASAKQPTPPKPKDTKAVTKVPVKKVTKTLDVSQITKSTEVVTKPSKATTTPQKNFKPIDANSIANNLKQSLSSVKFSSASSTNNSAFQGNPAILGYYDQVSSYLYSSWEQPSKLAVGGEPPSVLVKLSIDSDGRLTNYQIIKLSGYDDMDDSVKRMLSSVTRFPPPPNGAMTIEATMILTN
ncbi:MAG: TonB family protein [Lentisphaerota bacterium]